MSDNPSALSLFVAHRPALVAYASSIIGNRTLAEDLVQEAWLRFDEASKGRFFDDAKGYLYRIVRNLAIDGRRRAVREGRLFAEGAFDRTAETCPDETPTPEAVALYRNEIQCVMDAMEELPERTRIAFEMHRFGGAKLREIAEFLGISISLAQFLVAAAAEHCKERLRRS